MAPVEAGHRTNAANVLEGTLRTDGDLLRVSARLISTSSGESLWAGTFDARMSDLFTLEDSIASRVADALVPRLGGEDRKRIETRETDNAEAHRFYMKGRHLRAVDLTRRSLLEAAKNFQAAVRLDPSYALSHAALAEVTALNGLYYLAPAETMPLARESAKRALELDPTQSDCHCASAVVAFLGDLDFQAADRSFRKALELNPANAMCADWYGTLLAAQGRGDEASRHLQDAMRTSPAELASFVDFGVNDYYARRFDRAIAVQASALDRDPNFYAALVEIGRAYSLAGKHEQAIAALDRARRVEDVPWVAICHSWTLARAGQTERSRVLLRETEARKDYVAPIFRSIGWAALGERSTAMRLLEEARQERHPMLSNLKVDPMFDPLRGEPGFQALLRQLRFDR
jgi:Tfp pilus assembly protein PilF